MNINIARRKRRRRRKILSAFFRFLSYFYSSITVTSFVHCLFAFLKMFHMNIEQLTFKIRGCIFEVFKELGPGLLESVYEAALLFELKNQNLNAQAQAPVPVMYKSVQLELGFRLDLLVENEVIVEVKSVEASHDLHKKQLLNYLKLTGKKVGFLVNFNSSKLIDKESIIRIVNNY